MTIIVGVVARNGVVVAADSQAGCDLGVIHKRTDYTKIQEISPSESDVKGVVAGAGIYAYIKKAVGLLREGWDGERVSSVKQLEDDIEKVMLYLHKKYYVDRREAQQDPGLTDDIRDAMLLLGAADKAGGLLLATVDTGALADTEKKPTLLLGPVQHTPSTFCLGSMLIL